MGAMYRILAGTWRRVCISRPASLSRPVPVVCKQEVRLRAQAHAGLRSWPRTLSAGGSSGPLVVSGSGRQVPSKTPGPISTIDPTPPLAHLLAPLLAESSGWRDVM